MSSQYQYQGRGIPAIFLLTTLVIGDLSSLQVPYFQALPALAQQPLTDIQDHWAKTCIETLALQGIIKGYSEDNTFRPNAPVNRAELAVMLRRAFSNAPKVREPMRFIDIPSSFWAATQIQEAYQTGFMSAFNGSIFNATVEVTRLQALLAFSNGLKYQPTQPVETTLTRTFTDASDIPEGVRSAIAAATEQWIVVNYPDVSRLNPNQPVTRAEIAAFICQAKFGTERALLSSEYIARIPAMVESPSVVASPAPTPPTLPPPIRQTPATVPSPAPQPTAPIIAKAATVQAELSSDLDAEGKPIFTIKIIRNGDLIFNQPLSWVDLLSQADPNLVGVPVIAPGQFVGSNVVDLNGDGEPEVLVDFQTVREDPNCCHYSFIYEYDPNGNTYQITPHFWGTVSYELQDLRRDRMLEFVSVDSRFADQFTSYLESRYPLRVWQYRQGEMLDVTRNYLAEINTHAAQLWLEANEGLNQNREVKGILAAYLANKYLLGQGQDGWLLLQQVYRSRDRETFFSELRRWLEITGYITSENNDQGNLPQVTLVGDRQPVRTPAPPAEITETDTVDTTIETNGDATETDENDTTVAVTSDSATEELPRLFQRLVENTTTPILSLAISPDGRVLATSVGKNIKLWNLETGTLLKTLSGHAGDVRSVAFSPDGQLLASGSGDGTVRVWSVGAGQLRRAFWHSGWVTTVAFNQAGTTVIGCSFSQGIKMWSVETGTLLHTLNGSNPMALSVQQQILASNSDTRQVQLWDITTGKLQGTVTLPLSSEAKLRAMSVSEDGNTLAVAVTGTHSIFLVHLPTQTVRHTLTGHLDVINTLALSPDGNTLASSSQDGTIKLWEVNTGKLLHTLVGGGAISFSPDGNFFVGVHQNQNIQVWRSQDWVRVSN